MSTVQTAPQRVPLDDVAVELERALGGTLGGDCHIASIASRPSAYRTSFALDDVDVVLDDGRTFQLVVKHLGDGALTAHARRAKPDFLADPRREIDVYLGILTPLQWGTPICYGATVDPSGGRSRLILERVPGVELYQVGDHGVWRQVARWLAGFHAHFATDAMRALARSAAPVLSYDRDFYRVWPRRARAYAETRTPDVRRWHAWLAERYDAVVDRLASLPTTLIHGEFYASNILVHETSTGLRVCPVDWEMAAIGPGLIDLAALTAGSWSDDERSGFARTYREALTTDAGGRRSVDEVLTDLTFCRLHLAVQWLGWSAEWTPPREHAHDWLAEAMRLAEELGL